MMIAVAPARYPYRHAINRYRSAVRRGRVGMGDALQDTSQVIQGSGSILSGLAAMKVGWAVAAFPIVGTAIAGVTIALSLYANRKGPKQKTFTTKVVNDIEPHLIANLEGYLNGPRTRASQMQALANFDAGWQLVLTDCGNPATGKPGENCIAERSAGACHWKDAAGRCFNWFSAYRDPIANDMEVRPDPVAGSGSDFAPGITADLSAAAGIMGDVISSAGGLMLPLALLGVALVVANAD